MSRPVPDPIIAAYIEELTTDHIVSYSHLTLRQLNMQHGHELIDKLVADYFKEVREYDSRE